MKRWLTRLALGGIALGVAVFFRAPLLAHHSFAVSYIEADTIEVEGDVVEFNAKPALVDLCSRSRRFRPGQNLRESGPARPSSNGWVQDLLPHRG
jgi:hypothetical protein